jgi:hypothetical protein
MLRRFPALLPALAVLLLAACAAAPRNVDLSRESIASIRSVAIVMPPEPKSYSVVNMGNPALAFALVGGIFVAADQDNKQTKFYQAMQFQKFSVKAILAAHMEKKLNAAGYRTQVVEGPWEEKDGRFVLKTEQLSTDADALLLIVPTTAGFVSKGLTADYVPTITVAVRLLAKDRKTELYRAYHAYGWQPRADGWRFTPATRSFTDFDSLMAKPADSASALGESAEAVSRTIAQDLRRQR